jgi:hypothetical protein
MKMISCRDDLYEWYQRRGYRMSWSFHAAVTAIENVDKLQIFHKQLSIIVPF